MNDLEHDLKTITSPWYWIKRYVAVGCLVLVFVGFIGGVAWLLLFGG